MVRVLGAALLILGGGLLGIGAAEPLGRQSRALDEMCTGLSMLEQELELGGLPLCRMMEELAEQTSGTAKRLFSACGRELEQTDREGFPLLWEKLVSDCPELGREGIRLLIPLGNSLGRCGAEDQRKAAALVRERLEGLRRQVDSGRPARNRLCRALGLSGGAFAAVLLL